MAAAKKKSAPKKEVEALTVAGREVVVSSPSKVYFPGTGHRKIDVVRYFLAVADGALRGVRDRPIVLKRYVEGVEAPPFFQKRAPKGIPPWMRTVTLRYPSGRTADEVVVSDAAQLAYVANLGCVDLNPHPVRADDLEHPDELRVDLDPVPGVRWPQIVEVATVVRAALEDLRMVGFVKTSGSRGIHVYVRIERKWSFAEVRRAAQALAREVERRAPSIATSKWWKEERHGVFLDYNQNAKDHTVASAYSIRPTPDARVSMPLAWEQLTRCEPGDFTIATVPKLFAERGDAHAAIDDVAFSIEPLLELADEQDASEPKVKKKKTELRRAKHPLIVIGESQDKEAALAGLARWREKHAAIVPLLEPNDVLIDAMRGRFTTWTRVRVNLRNVPEGQRPAQGPLDPDDAPKFFSQKSS